MTSHDKPLYWLRHEIPSYLDKKGSAEIFIKDFNKDCASYYWYQLAIELAIARWPDQEDKLKKLRNDI